MSFLNGIMHHVLKALIAMLVLVFGFAILSVTSIVASAQSDETAHADTAAYDTPTVTAPDSALAVYSVDDVPNVRLQSNNNFVSDPTHILSAAASDTINLMLRQLEDSTKAQVAVVMLPAIDVDDEFVFAHDLFLEWGIGHKDTNDGLLILYVSDLRVIRFHVGDGLEGTLTDAMCKRIQQYAMVPNFKKGDTDRGMVEGVRYACDVIKGGELPWSDSDANDEEGWGWFSVGLAASLLGAGILEKLLKKCPECGKRGKLRQVGRKEYFTRGKREYYRSNFECRACGYKFSREHLRSSGGVSSDGGGSSSWTSSDSSGGSWGGGSSSGGGASSHW